MSNDLDATTAISPEAFVEASRPYHLTIGDLLNVPVGSTIHIYCLDRNMFDVSCDERINDVGKPTKPSHFFRRGYYMNFTRNKDLCGTWEMLEGNVPNEKTGRVETMSKDTDREFDVDFGKCWYPMKGGKVPMSDKQEIFRIPEEFQGKTCHELDPSMRVGWRGPMMLVENMDLCPHVVMRKSGYVN